MLQQSAVLLAPSSLGADGGVGAGGCVVRRPWVLMVLLPVDALVLLLALLLTILVLQLRGPALLVLLSLWLAVSGPVSLI